MERNCKEFGIELRGFGSRERGIVHVIGPELGATQPGTTIVCGDSHTSTHGAFGALAFGIGTTEVGHVLATQCLLQRKPKTLAINVGGTAAAPDVTAKDLILKIIGTIGVGGGTGHVIEYRGGAIEALSMEERMTICNMSIEAGARAGMVAPDDTTYQYMAGRPFAPQGAAWDAALKRWRRAAERRGREVRQRGHDRRREAAADGDVRHEPRHGDSDRRPGARGRRSGIPQGPRLHAGRGRQAVARQRRSTSCSSARARTAV